MKRFNRKPLIVWSILFMGAVLVSSCKKDDPEPIVYGNANLRVVNTVANSQDQDFYQGDTKISTTAVAYGGYSGYLTVKAGPTTISFKNTGTTTTTASTGVGLETGASYTAFLFSNLNGSSQITGFPDDPTAPASGKARVRFVNLGSSFTNNVNVATSSGTQLATGLGYLYVSAYYTIDANSDLTVSILNAPTSSVIPGSNFVAGKIYTVWFDAATATSAKYHVIVQN